LHFPGEIQKYLVHAGTNARGADTASASFQFLFECLFESLTDGRLRQKWLALALLLPACLVLFRRVSGAQVTVTRCLFAVCLLTTAAFFYYAYCVVDDLQYTYLGIFYRSVFLLVLTTVAMNLAVLASRNRLTRGAIAVVAVLVCGAALARGRFADAYLGSPEIPAFIEALERESKGVDAPVIVSFDRPDLWGIAIGFVVELDGRGKEVYVADEAFAVQFTKRFTRVPPGILERRPRRVGFTDPDNPSSRVIARTQTVVLQEMDPPFPPSGP
jgi:hypothetical protein